MTTNLRITIAQMNAIVGDVKGNLAYIEELTATASKSWNPDVIIFPELALTGYPPEDLLFRQDLESKVTSAIQQLQLSSNSIDIVVGYPLVQQKELFNAVGWFQQGELIHQYAKQCLPNYRVFDEKRYFTPGTSKKVINALGQQVGISICEDIWQPEPMQEAAENGAQFMINVNASPFHINKLKQREKILQERAKQGGMPIIYVNMVGGQDELVFDGCSMIVSATGEVVYRAPSFMSGLFYVEMQLDTLGKVDIISEASNLSVQNKSFVYVEQQQRLAELAEISETAGVDAIKWKELRTLYCSLMLGLADYVNKNNFSGVIIGLSGGIDSALTLAIAVDALGAGCVTAVMLPSVYTSQRSLEDAREIASRFKVDYREYSIESVVKEVDGVLLSDYQEGLSEITAQNIQARSRAVLLMALSNETGHLVLVTSNKSELAVGYTTLYGDMAGGFAVLKDVLKTNVYSLAKFRNKVSQVIPESIIQRAPTAELAPGQKDEDSLPPYDRLDQVIRLYVECDMSLSQIVAQGCDRQEVKQVISLIHHNEYKRRQAAIGLRVSERGFGRDWRYPVTFRWSAE